MWQTRISFVTHTHTHTLQFTPTHTHAHTKGGVFFVFKHRCAVRAPLMSFLSVFPCVKSTSFPYPHAGSIANLRYGPMSAPMVRKSISISSLWKLRPVID